MLYKMEKFSNCLVPALAIAALAAVLAPVVGLIPALYSVKTGYEDSTDSREEFIRNQTWTDLASIFNESDSVDGCRPVGLYGVYRHGSRYPSASEIDIFNYFLSNLKNSDINSDYAYLKKEPSNRYRPSLSRELGEEGYREMIGLGMRLRNRFPSLLNDTPFLSRVSFQSTDSNRTRFSAEGFLEGVADRTCDFERSGENVIIASCQGEDGITEEGSISFSEWNEDRVLRGVNNCDRYIVEIEENPDAVREYLDFGEGAEVSDLLSKISWKLTPEGGDPYPISQDELQVLFMMCGYERALFGSSVWCDLFETSDLRVGEYWLDIEQYYTSGYGNELSYAPMCVLLNNMTSYLKTVVSGADFPIGAFKVAHTDAIQTLLSLMQLYRDEVPLLSDNFPTDRDWLFRSSSIVPFGASIASTVLECGEEYDISYKILMTHNEQPIKVGPCENYFCDYDLLMSFLTEQSVPCNYYAICSIGGAMRNTLSLGLWAVMLFISQHLCF